jgi:hypothetical protein
MTAQESWLYRRWIAVLHYLDLQGSDGRASQSKLAAFTVLWFGIGCAVFALGWRNAATPSGSVVTLVIAGLSASFGRSVLVQFLGRFSGKATAEDRTVTTHSTRPPHDTMDQDEGDHD